ncbi:MAG: tRNA (N6-isopentenyl adenosine(37)-C2)-methylthiotransferase MiaB [Clostridia bacterium]|nr:tRNA (N6-isopentenyl adenosine(37)-C2)-methylthiotransferase MiaB [Clostridia bacterium]
MQKLYKIITYGCQMNVHESEKLAGMLESLNYKMTDDTKKADIIVFNTCSIREGAVSKAFGNIGALKQLKHDNKNLIIAVGGCMTQNKQDALKLKRTFPFVDIIFGTHNLHKFKQYLIDFNFNHERIFNIWEREDGVPNMTEVNRTSGLNAWVNINFGCNNFCAYCIVPYVRGRERSRNMDELINECKGLIEEGYKTITLLGQNVNSYGNDINDANLTFANLLSTVANLEGDFIVKFMTSHPKDLTDEVIDVVANNPKVSKAVHLPVQSGSNDVLLKMNRGYTVEHYLEIVNKLKQKVKNLNISSDFIVGFPGETEEDFKKTKELIEAIEYDNLFAYIFSKRNGTKAANMADQVPYEIKNRRVNELLNLQKTIAERTRNKLVGREINVLVNTFKNNKYYAKTDAGRIVELAGENINLSNFYKAKVLAVDHKKITAQKID